MSEPKRDDEPTMEEILASIRKIISEDEPDGAEGASAADGGSGGGEEPEPMELTQMVSEDGSVVDLRSDRPGEAAPPEEAGPNGAAEFASVTAEPSEAAEPSVAAEPLVPDDTPVHADLVGDDDGIELAAETPHEPEPDIVAEPEREIVAHSEPEPDIVAEPEPEPDIVAEPEPEPEIVADPEPEADIVAEPNVVGEPEDAPLAEAESRQEAPGAADGQMESLVSERAAAAATAAMTRLNDSLSSDPAPAAGSDKTLEDLVRETLTPHLKAWLDENLPRLVERIVREEIDRIVRRSEFR